jgi:hypothetical protein
MEQAHTQAMLLLMIEQLKDWQILSVKDPELTFNEVYVDLKWILETANNNLIIDTINRKFREASNGLH